MSYSSLTFIMLLVLFSYNLKTNYYHYKFGLFYGIMISFLIHLVMVKYSIAIGALIGFMAIQSLYHAFFHHFTYEGPTNENSTSSLEFLKTTSVCAAVLGALAFLPAFVAGDSIEIMPYLIIIGSIWTIISPKVYVSKWKTKINTYGFGANSSVDATLMSIMVSFSLLIHPTTLTYFAIVLAGIAIARTKAAMGAAGYITCLSVYFFPYSLVLIPIGLILANLYYDKIKVFLSPRGRYEIWEYSIKVCGPFWKPLTGIGAGAYRYVVPKIQCDTGTILIKNPDMPKELNYHLWAHNDLLQFFLECGFIGIVLLLFSVFDITVLASGNRGAIAFIACWAINSLGNFNNHLAPDVSLLTLFLINLQ